MQLWSVDHDYIPVFDMKMIKGRAFSREFPGDSSAIVINEQAARLFGHKDPVGEDIQTFAITPGNSIDETRVDTYKIIGVIENFHFESMRENIAALSMILAPSQGRISFKYDAGHTPEVIRELETKWKEMAPGQPFQYSFLDDQFGRMYESEQRTGTIFTSFSILAIFIASLGLFALAAFMTEQRTKEIGIRKVMGATMSNIVYLLLGNFGKLILIAFVLATPIAWYGIDQWLEEFAYKDIPGITVYMGAGIIALIIAGLTIS